MTSLTPSEEYMVNLFGLLELVASAEDASPCRWKVRGLEVCFAEEVAACPDRDLERPSSASPILDAGADLLPIIPYSTAT